jgi:hypothetical protein
MMQTGPTKLPHQKKAAMQKIPNFGDARQVLYSLRTDDGGARSRAVQEFPGYAVSAASPDAALLRRQSTPLSKLQTERVDLSPT